MSTRLDFDPRHLEPYLSPQLRDLAKLDPAEVGDFVRSLPAEALAWLPYLWEFWARPEQVWRPGSEMITLYQAGRGWGKTRVGAQAVVWVAEHTELLGFGRGQLDEKAPIIALVGRTAHDCIATMINGPSGILACSPPWNRPRFWPSQKLLRWPNGLRAYYFTAERPETLRGPNIGFAWADEVAFFKSLRGFAVGALENIEQAMRQGAGKAVYTTTPVPTAAMFSLHARATPRDVVTKRPDKEPASRPASPSSRSALDDIVDQLNKVAAEAPQTPQKPPEVRIVRGSSLDNAANVRKDWIEAQRAKRGTRVGRQEVDGELLTGNPLTLFPFELLNKRRVILEDPMLPGETVQKYIRRVLDIVRVGVAGDPNGSEDPEAAEFGIQVVGSSRSGREYSLEDLSGHHSPLAWPSVMYDAALMWGADAIIGETNYGGSMIAAALETHVRGLAAAGQDVLPIPFVGVTAKGGKATRLKVFAQAYEQGLVYSVGDPSYWAPLEGQLHAFNPAEHPDKQVARIEVNGRMETLLFDRMDARVWGHLWISDHAYARSRSVTMIGDMGRAKNALDGFRL